MKKPESSERVKVWSVPELANLRLMHASYVTQTFPRHTHETFGVGVIEKGALGFFYRGENVVASPGEISLVNPGEPHTGHAAVEAGWTYRMFYLSADSLRDAASQMADRPRSAPFFPPGVIHDESLASLIRALHMDLEDERADRLEIEGRFLCMLTRLIQRHADAPAVEKKAGRERAGVKRAIDLIEACSNESISIERLASVAGLSPYHFIRVFQSEVGLSPHAYLTQTRVRKAKAQLAKGRGIAETAYETGFADQSHLTRQFKRIVGITPASFRNFIQDRGSRKP